MFLSESRMGDAETKIVVDRPGAPSGPTGEIAMTRIMASTSLLLSKVVASHLVAAGVDGDVRGEDNASGQAPAWIRYNSEGSSGLR